MIPAALLGTPAKIFAIIGPIHLFMQFWYHTKLIDKLGWLEHIIITPSHHRVHHAINPEYLDKNYGQIFIIWDKIFGSFQPELENVKPVYGTLRPARTWNPIIINYKHFWQLIQDAYHTSSIWDKIRIWFMPTGWRPDDVQKRYPIYITKDPKNQKKYETNISFPFVIWSFIQLSISVILMFHFFTIIHLQSMLFNYIYGALIMLHVFSFTSALDMKKYSIVIELFKIFIMLGLTYHQGFLWFGLQGAYVYLIIIYSLISVSVTCYFYKNSRIQLA